MNRQPHEALNDVKIITGLAGVSLDSDHIQLNIREVPHTAPSKLPAGKMAVYVFQTATVTTDVASRHVPLSYNHRIGLVDHRRYE